MEGGWDGATSIPWRGDGLVTLRVDPGKAMELMHALRDPGINAPGSEAARQGTSLT